jgi:hypothetical protein
VRAYADEQLAVRGKRADAQRRRLAWASETAAGLVRRLRRPDRAEGSWTVIFDAVADDLRAALADAPPGRDAMAYRLARALAQLAYGRRFLSEALDHAVGAADRAPDPREAVAELLTAASMAFAVAPARRAYDLLCAAAQIALEAGDGPARVIALARAVVTANRFPSGFPHDVPHDDLLRLLRTAVAAAGSDPPAPTVAAHLAAARAWNGTGEKYHPDPGLAEASAVAARRTGDPVLVSGALDALGAVAVRAGRFVEAQHIAAERLALLDLMDRDHPDAAAEILDALHHAWLSSLAVGDLPAAHAAAEAIMDDDLLGVHPYRPACKVVPPLILLGRFAEGLRHAEPMWEAWQRSGAPVAAWLAPAAASVALAHGLRGDNEAFRRWRARAERTTGAGNPVLVRQNAAVFAFVDARLALHRGPPDDAAALVDRAFGDFPRGFHEMYAAAAGAELAVAAHLPDAAERLAAAASAGAQNRWAAACLARARGRLHGDPTALAESVRGWERIGARYERACTLLLLPDRAADGRAELAACLTVDNAPEARYSIGPT